MALLKRFLPVKDLKCTSMQVLITICFKISVNKAFGGKAFEINQINLIRRVTQAMH